MADTADTVATTLRLPQDMWRDIRVEAAKEGKPASQWCRESLALVLKRVKESNA